MGKNEPVSLESLEKICAYLGCNIGEIVDFSSTTSSSKTNSKDYSCTHALFQ